MSEHTSQSTDRLDIGDVETAEEGETGRRKPPLLARLLFGGVLAYNGYTQLSNLEQMAGYADAKDVPKPGKMVPFTGGMLLAGGLGVVFWRAPKFFAGALATFLAVTTPTMHDFWNADEESRQSEMNHFLKNVAMLGAALAFVGWDDE